MQAAFELAKLYVASRQPEQARTQLDELLALWREADTDLPLLRDAVTLRKKIGS